MKIYGTCIKRLQLCFCGTHNSDMMALTDKREKRSACMQLNEGQQGRVSAQKTQTDEKLPVREKSAVCQSVCIFTKFQVLFHTKN
jgi:hypothetical protein